MDSYTITGKEKTHTPNAAYEIMKKAAEEVFEKTGLTVIDLQISWRDNSSYLKQEQFVSSVQMKTSESYDYVKQRKEN